MQAKILLQCTSPQCRKVKCGNRHISLSGSCLSHALCYIWPGTQGKESFLRNFGCAWENTEIGSGEWGCAADRCFITSCRDLCLLPVWKGQESSGQKIYKELSLIYRRLPYEKINLEHVFILAHGRRLRTGHSC